MSDTLAKALADDPCDGYQTWDEMDESDRDRYRALAREEIKPPRYRPQPILDLFRLSCGDSDEWGTVMGFCFAIAEALYLGGQAIPEDWQFRPAPSLEWAVNEGDESYIAEHVEESWPDSEIHAMITESEATLADVLYAGIILIRYATWLKLAGKDY